MIRHSTRRILPYFLASCLTLGSAFAQPQSNRDKSEQDAASPNLWAESISVGEKLFALEVAPVLEAKCFACHGQDADGIESGFVLTSRESSLRGGDTGEPALVPGDRNKSWIYKSATWEHDELQMPPKENDRLAPETLEALGAWIDAGAPWPDAQRIKDIRQEFSSGVTVTTAGGLDANWDQRRYEPETLWAYQPLPDEARPRAVDLPASEFPATNEIDLFVNAGLAELGLTPAPRADRQSLIRRVYFDLTGLPPAPEEVQSFVQDALPEELAWARLVDRLLASPRLGEQWAGHWLDTVRYADSAGFANDYERPNTWRYRDYVIRCLSEDRPFDQFISEQIAGDEINPDDPEMLVAVGMLRMGPWEQTGMSVDKVTRQQFLDDVTDMIGQAFLAHPLQCARCHDHKFDPIPTRDYYRIQAVFATTQFADRQAEFLAAENQNGCDEQRRYLEQRIVFFQSLLDELNAKEERAAHDWYADRGWKYASRNEKLKQGVPEDEIAPKKVGFTPEDFGLERISRKYLERHRWELDRYEPIAYSLYSGPTPVRRSVNSRIPVPDDVAHSGQVEQTAILTGGDIFSPTVSVTPGVLSILTGLVSPSNASEDSSLTKDTFGRRTEFARWLVDSERNPLTPRVLVNRFWQHHFGQGLVKTPNNFGTAAAGPSHPALLDYLAAEFVRSGWSAKHIHRMILLSQAYCRAQSYARDALRQQQIELDPNQTSYATFQARRLTAEEIRDSILLISGLLNQEIGGVPIRPDLNAEVAVQPRQIMGTYAPVYQPSPLPQARNRRAIYALRLRGLRDPMLEIFNQPSPDLPCEIRDSSTVAPQALTLFNSPFSLDRALAMATRLQHEYAETTDADVRIIRRAFDLAYGREVSPEELQACLQHWQAMTARYESIELPDVIPPAVVTRSFVDENTGEQFSFSEPLEQNRDYVPAVRPSQADARTRGLADVCLVLLSSNELLYVP